jgi:Tol biopolymer transport system component
MPAAEAPSESENRFLSGIRQLTFDGKRSGEGYFATDGKSLIFQSEREPANPFYQIYILDLSSGETHRVSPGFGKTTCSFFQPRTDRVLFASTHLDRTARSKQQAELDLRASGKQRRYAWDYDEQFDLFTARRDGSRVQRITASPGYDAEASFSPDGRQIVFCSFRHAYPTNKLSVADHRHLESDPAWFGEIYLMDADGSRPRRLTDWPGYDGGAFFSPDGKRILWRHFSEDGAIADVYTMNLRGADRRRVTQFGAMSWAPYFHPSGDYIIFTANKLGFGNFELFIVDATGEREPVRVTFTEGFDGLPVFSPDGRELCWTSGRAPDGKSQLFLAKWNHDAAIAALKSGPAVSATHEVVMPMAADLTASISKEDLLNHISYLASDALEGRATGSKGAQLAADYIADKLRRAGLQPIGNSPDFFQSFEFDAGARIAAAGNQLTVSRTNGPVAGPFEVDRDFRPLSFSANSEAEGEVIFVGYGLSVPGKAGEGYDSYAGLDVSNKVVLALRYVPEDVEPKRRQELNRYGGLRYKAMLAREHGAKAVLFVTGPTSPNAGELVGLSTDGSFAGSAIIAATITTNVANALLAGSGRDLSTLQSALDKENPHAESGFVPAGVRVRLATAVEHLKSRDRNVIGFLPAAKEVANPEYVLVGAHYDHLGFGEAGAMRRKGEEKAIHPGADDNASGTSAVLELAASLSAQRAQNPTLLGRAIVFALWSGEEMGLIGSSYFTEHPPLALSNMAAFVNFDMIGRLRDNKLILQGTGSSSAWRRLIEKRNIQAGFNVTLQDDPYLPTDVTAFYPKGIPVLNFFTGSHDDYHRPTDTPATINYEGAERITRFAEGIILDLAKNGSRPDYVSVARSDGGGGSRENLRAYLGTIPDYATEVAGVKLSGVRAAGPADKAGLKGGDVIVEFGGQKIANIYDYTFAMDAVKIGQPVSVVILRAGQRMTLSVTPEARK